MIILIKKIVAGKYSTIVKKETIGIIKKILKWFKAAPIRILSPLYKVKFNDIPDPINNILPKLRLAKLEIKIKFLIINIVNPHKDFYIINILKILYINFINTNSITKNKPDIKNNFN